MNDNSKASKMSRNGEEHTIADVHFPDMESHAPDKTECVQEHSSTVQPQATEGIVVDNPAIPAEPPLGQRVRRMTEKGQEQHDEQVIKVAHRFSVCYEKWKDATKEANQALSGKCSDDLLDGQITKVRNTSRSLNDVYDDWKRLEVPDLNTRRKIDTCETVTKKMVKDAMDLIDAREEATAHRHTTSQRHEEHRVIEEVMSVASGRTGTSSRHTKCSSASRKSAAAEVAANKATLEVQLEQEHYIKELQRLEVEAAQLKAKQEAENAERQRVLEAKRRELDRLETIKKLKAAEARQQVYDQSIRSCPATKGDGSDEEINDLLHRGSVKKEEEVKPQTINVPLHRVSVKKEEVKPQTSPLRHHSTPPAVAQARQENKYEDDTTALVKALAEAISASRIPLPEPTVFSGDPLRFNDWKVSFQTLVDRKNIPAEEKIYYLRKYVGGSAKRAIESYFLLGTEPAYYAAWDILEER